MKTLLQCCMVLLFLFISLYAKITVKLPYSGISVQNNSGIAQFNAHLIKACPGEPLLPVYRTSVLLPPDADLNTVSFFIEGLEEECISGTFSVEPAPPHATVTGLHWPRNKNIFHGKDVDIYTSNEIFPKQHVTILDKGKKNCFNMVDVQVTLFRYNPIAMKLFQIKKGNLIINFARKSGYRSSRNTNILIPEFTRKSVKKRVINYEEFAGRYETDFNFTDDNKMVIITTSAIQSGALKFEDFVQSKKDRGIDIQVVTEDDWGGGSGSTAASNIRKWLQDNYQQLAIHHVLCIGHNTGDVAMMIFPDFNTYIPGTDAYSEWAFAQLTGDFDDDAKCEVSVGRIPVFNNDMDKLDAILEKTMAYENADKNSIAWRFNALMGAGGFSTDSKGDIPYNQAHDDFIVKTPPWKDYRIYGTSYGQPTGTPDKVGISVSIFTNQWKNNSYGLVSYLSHGNATSASSVFSSSSASSIGNDYPSFSICGACTNASPNNPGSICYSMLRYCCVGSIGGTSYTDYEPNTLDHLETGGSNEGFAYNFIRCMVADSMEAGDCMTYLRDLDPNYPTGKWLNRVPYNLFGDPSIGIYTCKGPTEVTSLPKETTFNNKLYAISHGKGPHSFVTFNFNQIKISSAVLRIYTVSGSEIDKIAIPVGIKSLKWDMTNKKSFKVSTGIYIARLCRNNAKGFPGTVTAKFIIR